MGTLGVVVVHRPDRPVADLPAVSGLAAQVDELLIVRNGEGGDAEPPVRSITFPANRGTAAAWNAALAEAKATGHRWLYVLDQDSVPSATAVARARAVAEACGAAAVVQPPARNRLGLDPFPWSTAASGSLYGVEVLDALGGFDERLFVDEVDHELLARLVEAGHEIAALAEPTIDHRAGSPRPVRLLGARAVVSGHGAERRRLQGHSAGLLVRRYARRSPATSARLLLRHALNAVKDGVAGDRASSRALLAGLAAGVATSRPPDRAADRACPYCDGPLLGRFASVEDWRYGAGPPTDVYRCARCGALAAGRVPPPEEVASWYSGYYTHSLEPARTRIWSRLWPTASRREELGALRRYLTAPGETGRFLEVGTGAGERLVELAGAGWDVVGQDPDPEAGRLARARGITVHRRPVGELAGREGPFDLIGMTHVLEHVAEPAELLQACAALLAPGGRLCIVAPNADSLGRRLFGRWWFGLEQPRHLAIPTLASLERVTPRAGLQPVEARSVSANAAVILGGSLDRPLRRRLPPGRLRRGVQFAMALAGQALGRAATVLCRDLGEELVWLGKRRED